MNNKRTRIWIIVLIILALLIITGLCAFSPAGHFTQLLVSLVVDSIHGPNIVDSAWSPDMEFEAYVLEWPSIDPPNQTLYIQRRDEQHFVIVAKLGEDVDSIRSIRWSDGADLVVFLTRNYLYAVHTPGFETVAIPLANEFYRYRTGKFGTYGGGIPKKEVTDIVFSEPGMFTYLLAGEDSPRTIRMADLFGYQP